MKTVPTLEAEIAKRAEKKLENDLGKLNNIFRGYDNDNFVPDMLKDVKIIVKVSDDTVTDIRLTELIKTGFIATLIKAERRPEYIKREIDSLLSKVDSFKRT